MGDPTLAAALIQEISTDPDPDPATNLTVPDLAPTPQNLSPVVLADGWNLPSEPWVFLVDSAGIVQARLEGVIPVEELEAEL